MYRILLVLLAMLLGGCSTVSDMTSDFFVGKDNLDPPAELQPIQAQVSVSKLWSSKAGVGAEDAYLRLTPVVAYDKVYTADVKGRVSAYEAGSGRAAWTVATKQPISGGPGVGDGLVLVGTSEAEIIALDAQTGKERWRKRVSSEVLAPPRADEGVVIVRTVDGKLAALNSESGEQIWLNDRTVPVLSLRGTSAPVIVSGAVIVGFANGKLAALTLREGKTIWETRIAVPSGRTDLDRMVDIDADPLVGEGVIHVVTFQGNIATLEMRSGKVLWRRDMSSHAGIGMDEFFLYVSDDQSHVWALDRRNSGTLWKQDALHARNVTAPVAFENYVVVGDLEGYLHLMNRDDGSFVGRVRVGDDRIIAPPVVEGDTLFVETSGGTLAAYRLK